MMPEALVAIVGMALATYGVRAGGLALTNRLPKSGLAAAWLRQIPSAVLAALVAPAVLTGGPAEATAASATALVMITTKNLFAAMIAGVLVVYLARSWL